MSKDFSYEVMPEPVLPQNLYEYIQLMKIRTGMYLGESTITNMRSHIDGYLAACRFKEIEEDLQPDFYEFHNFVAYHYSWGESTAGWKNIILEECGGDEQQALATFFELFDTFILNKKH